MSYIVMPDPHPGRCPNFRTIHGASIQAVRCLESADTEHVCRFPEVVAEGTTSVVYTSRLPDPEPWVPPPPAGTPCSICGTHHTTPGNCGGAAPLSNLPSSAAPNWNSHPGGSDG